MRPYTEEAYSDDTMTVYQVPIFGEFKHSCSGVLDSFLLSEFHRLFSVFTLQLSRAAGRAGAARLEVPPPPGRTTPSLTATEEVQVSREIHLSEPLLFVRNKHRVLIVCRLVGERADVTRDPSLVVSFICKVRRFQLVVISVKYNEHMKDVCVF